MKVEYRLIGGQYTSVAYLDDEPTSAYGSLFHGQDTYTDGDVWCLWEADRNEWVQVEDPTGWRYDDSSPGKTTIDFGDYVVTFDYTQPAE